MITLSRRHRLKAVTLLALCFSCLSLSACGRNSAPTPPGPDEKVTYPRMYPAE